MMDRVPCIRCHAELASYDQAISIYMYAQTVGVSPKQKSDSERIKFCPTCSISLAMGPEPEGMVNAKVYRMMCNLIGPCEEVGSMVWRRLSTGVLVPEVQILPPREPTRLHPAV
jgi:hypothetical protein